MHEEALSPQCTGTLFINRMKNKRPAIFKATRSLPDANRNPGTGLLGSVRLWVTVTHRVKGGELPATEPQARLPETWSRRRLAGGGWGQEEEEVSKGGDAWEGLAVTKSFAGGRWKSPGSLSGKLRRHGRREASGSLLFSLLPAPLLLLAVDCKEQRKEGCIKPKEERTPAIHPHRHRP